MIEKMSKLEVLFLESDIDKVILALQKSGGLHVEPVATPAEARMHFKRFHLTPDLERKIQSLDHIAAQIEHIFTTFGADIPSPAECLPLEDDVDPDLISGRIRNIDKRISKLHRRRMNLLEDFRELSSYTEARQSVGALIEKAEAELAEPSELSGLMWIPPEESRMVRMAREIILRATGAHRSNEVGIWHSRVDSPWPMILIAVKWPQECRLSIREDLWEEGFRDFDFPNRTGGMPLSRTLSEYDSIITDQPLKMRGLEKDETSLFNENKAALAKSYHSSRAAAARLRRHPDMARTRHAIIANGWIPASKLDPFTESLGKKFGSGILVNELEIIHDETGRIPTSHANPGLIRPFEKILRLFPPATYGSMDPTALNSLTFPLFFGFMLGDAGYGLVILALSRFLSSRVPKHFGFVTSLMNAAGISSIVFGILFWEFFGNLAQGMSPVSFLPIIDRHHHVKECMVISLLIGALHLTLGFGLGAYKAVLSGKPRKAAGEIAFGAFIWLLFGTVGSMKTVGALPEWVFIPSLAGIGIATVVICSTLGIFSVMELFSTVSNVLSYTRLMAIGMSSVIIAYIANTLGAGTESLLTGIMVGLSLHLVNLVLGIFGPTLHALRLHYVEFLPKFYETGGREYEPFEYV